MKSYKQKVLIPLMRVLSICVVLLMSLGFINIMSCKESNSERPYTDEEIEYQLKYTYTDFVFNLYQRSFMFYPFVFVLGAFWSRKKMVKSGII